MSRNSYNVRLSAPASGTSVNVYALSAPRVGCGVNSDAFAPKLHNPSKLAQRTAFKAPPPPIFLLYCDSSAFTCLFILNPRFLLALCTLRPLCNILAPWALGLTAGRSGFTLAYAVARLGFWSLGFLSQVSSFWLLTFCF